jgi:hypothetical protein
MERSDSDLLEAPNRAFVWICWGSRKPSVRIVNLLIVVPVLNLRNMKEWQPHNSDLRNSKNMLKVDWINVGCKRIQLKNRCKWKHCANDSKQRGRKSRGFLVTEIMRQLHVQNEQNGINWRGIPRIQFLPGINKAIEVNCFKKGERNNGYCGI